MAQLQPDEEQRAICDWVTNTPTGSAGIEAVAGSGKTTTLLFVMQTILRTAPLNATALLSLERVRPDWPWVVVRPRRITPIGWTKLHLTLELPMGRRARGNKHHTPVWQDNYNGWVFKLDKRQYDDGYRKLAQFVNETNNEENHAEPIILYLAFNKRIVAEVETKQRDDEWRLFRGIRNDTFHRFGKSLLVQLNKNPFKKRKRKSEYHPSLADDHGKKMRIVQTLLENGAIPQAQVPSEVGRKRWIKLLVEATVLAQNFGLSHQDIAEMKNREDDHPFEEALAHLLQSEPDDETVLNCLEPILRACETDQEIDFEDMIWLPVVCNVDFPNFLWILVDEAQDLNPCQIKLLSKIKNQHPHTRFVVVGDRDQAIYAFRGADPRSFDNLSLALSVDNTFNLSGCRRCPITHVALARLCLNGRDMTTTRQDNGTIEFCPVDEISLRLICCNERNVEDRKANLVLCRKNLPIVKLAYKCISENRSVSIFGEHDIGVMLLELISLYKTQQSPFNDFIEARQQMLVGVAYKKKLFSRVVFLEEYFEAAKWLFEQSNQNLDRMEESIRKLFFEKPDENTIFFSSTHRAKGDQAATVWILNAELYLPYHWGKELILLSSEQKKQELNCLYVALTRCCGNALVICSNTLTSEYALEEWIESYKQSME